MTKKDIEAQLEESQLEQYNLLLNEKLNELSDLEEEIEELTFEIKGLKEVTHSIEYNLSQRSFRGV